MNECFMVRSIVNGGGNRRSRSMQKLISVRRWLAIGDSLAASCVADRLHQLGHQVRWLCHPLPATILKWQPSISSTSEFGYAEVDLDGIYEKDPRRATRHFSDFFMTGAGLQLQKIGIDLGPPLNCRPRLRLPPFELACGQGKLSQHPRPWIMVVPRSETYRTRQVSHGTWAEIVKRLPGTCFWTSLSEGPAELVDLKCRNLADLTVYLSAGDLCISVDTGPMHIAAALGVPVLALGQSSSPELHLSDQCDFMTIEPALECLNCQKNLCPINPDIPPCQHFEPSYVAGWAIDKLRARFHDDVSAVVPIYKPDVTHLNHCLENLIPQVNEIVVSAEADSGRPEGIMTHPKIRQVRTWKRGIGFSGNCNFGARHTHGKFLLFVNDDCFLNEGAVEKMKGCLRPDVGAVTCLLRYPDGSIYYGGKGRAAGERGWHHLNHRKFETPIGHNAEQESLCGCALMTRRDAFYQVNAFDETIPFYAQDDAYSLALRSKGWKLVFTPHASGIHVGSQTSRQMDTQALLSNATAQFEARWGRYLDHNLQRVPGDFSYL